MYDVEFDCNRKARLAKCLLHTVREDKSASKAALQGRQGVLQWERYVV